MCIRDRRFIALPDQRATSRIAWRSSSETSSSVNSRTWRVRRNAVRMTSAVVRSKGFESFISTGYAAATDDRCAPGGQRASLWPTTIRASCGAVVPRLVEPGGLVLGVDLQVVEPAQK